jgi:hypothetical protein
MEGRTEDKQEQSNSEGDSIPPKPLFPFQADTQATSLPFPPWPRQKLQPASSLPLIATSPRAHHLLTQPVRPLNPTSLSPRKGSQLQTACLSRGVQDLGVHQDLGVQHWPYLHAHLHPKSKRRKAGGWNGREGESTGTSRQGHAWKGQRCGVWCVGWGCQLVSASWNTVHNKLSLSVCRSVCLSFSPPPPLFLSVARGGWR